MQLGPAFPKDRPVNINNVIRIYFVNMCIYIKLVNKCTYSL